MTEKVRSIILIGMPGAGKSTIGVLLARELGMDFLDTDIAIQVHEGKTLQQILDESNYLRLRAIEETVLLQTNDSPRVIATGGSAVYSAAAMDLLSSLGTVIYLRVPLDVLERRIDNYDTRGIARQPGQDFGDLFTERSGLYDKYADITLDCGEHIPADIVEELVSRLN
jgi:shikimate kinase